MISFRYKVFIEVASHLSFSKAAEVLFISQPAISKHIKKLEVEIGLPLFERQGITIKLTPPGKKLFEYLHQAKKIEGQIESDVQIIKDQFKAKGDLKIGASTTLSLYVLPKILSAFHKKFPNVQLLLLNRNSEHILEALVKKDIDLAIIESHHRINAVQYQPFMHDEIIPVCANHSPYASEAITLEQLRSTPLAIRERGSGTLAVLSKELERHHTRLKDLNVIARMGGTEALKNFLLEDNAIGFLSRLAVKKELKTGTLKEVSIDSLQITRNFNFLQRKGEESTGLIRSFIKEAQSYYNF
jgi:DNA-binding transcriptional LysR family regulator